MTDRRPVEIDTDVAYFEQGVLLEFYKNRNLVLAQENKALRQRLNKLERQAPSPPRVGVRRGSATKET